MVYSQVGGGDVVPLDEGTLLVDDLIDTKVRVEVGLDVLEDGDGAIGTSTSARVVSEGEDIQRRSIHTRTCQSPQ